jgi:hypothetical protein
MECRARETCDVVVFVRLSPWRLPAACLTDDEVGRHERAVEERAPGPCTLLPRSCLRLPATPSRLGTTPALSLSLGSDLTVT